MLAAFLGLTGVLSPLQTYNKAQPLRISQKRYWYLEEEHTTSAIHSQNGFVNGMVASHLLCHSGTINRHSLNGALLS
ncbi:hypothetical protein DMT41_07525 [Klebsiella variicola]|nr:hypothetical protein DMT41_07525 [Klebsiella variicola]